MNFNKIIYDLVDLDVGTILENEPMYKHTTYKVGGPARLFVKVKNKDALCKMMKYIRDNNIKHMVIGKGSDLLFSDKEYNGIIISLAEMNQISINGVEVKVEAGVNLIQLAYQCAKVGLSGFEFAGGIPGSVGGGIYMNAGAYKYCIADIFKEAIVLTSKNEMITLNKEEMNFSYRHSVLQNHKDWILLEATFEMNTKDPNEIKAILDKRKEKRMSTQPWNFPSAGSVFRNPDEKGAWKYIDECGLRGYEIGGAQVSPKHSNFIVNNGYASAKDILDLILLVEKTVFNKFNVELRKEVILVNWE
jgi:UDP-N-acetylmuramate dehydrogenase